MFRVGLRNSCTAAAGIRKRAGVDGAVLINVFFLTCLGQEDGQVLVLISRFFGAEKDRVGRES